MFKILTPLALLTTLFFVNPLFADPVKSVDCKTATSVPDQNVCAQQQLTKLNSKLADTYTKSLTAANKLDKIPNGNIKKSLEFSQQNWQNYLKASCDNVAAVYQGTSDVIKQTNDCKKQTIKTRTKQLAQLYLTQ